VIAEVWMLHKQKVKDFFFEKKKQKTFAHAASLYPKRPKPNEPSPHA
jgi:hypothetical protein